MPGAPMNPDNSELNKLRNEAPKILQENEEQEQVRSQTDFLNKRLLVSFLERINKSEEHSDSEESQTENKDKDQVDSGPKDVQQENEQNEPVVRELTQTDTLNKQLLVSFLERINKSEEYSDSKATKTEDKDKDQFDSDF